MLHKNSKLTSKKKNKNKLQNVTGRNINNKTQGMQSFWQGMKYKKTKE